MTIEEINEYIYEHIMGGICTTAFLTGRRVPVFPGDKIPDYCSDESPRRLLNEVVAKVNFLEYDKVLKRMSSEGKFFAGLIYTATAKQIATACIEAHKESTIKGNNINV